MRYYFSVLLLSALPLAGCAGMAKVLEALDTAAATQADAVQEAQAQVAARQAAVSTLRLQLKSAEAAETPDLPQLRAELQVAETELEAAEARLVRAKVARGFGYAEVTTRLIGSPLEVLFPGLGGPALRALIALLGAGRAFFSNKQEGK